MYRASAALILTLAATPAAAQDVASATDPQTVVDQITALGYEARLEPYESGRPRIQARIVGVNYAVAFYGCLEDMTDCLGLMFTAGFDLNEATDWKVVNDWNETRIYTRAFLDDESDPYVQMPVPIAEALSAGEMRRLVELWENALVRFTDEIGFDRPEDSAGAPAPRQPVASGTPTPPAQPAPPVGRVAPKKGASAGALRSDDQ